jgi:hypothetical protein
MNIPLLRRIIQYYNIFLLTLNVEIVILGGLKNRHIAHLMSKNLRKSVIFVLYYIDAKTFGIAL